MKKGFTLVELLIVIGILAVLSTATVLILNPAQILQESRDTQRLNDLNTLSSAISLYFAAPAAGVTPSLGSATFTCGSLATNNFGSSKDATGTAPTSYFVPAVLAQGGVRTVNGLGWVAAKLSDISGGSPLAVLPQDPINSGGTVAVELNYQFACGSGTDANKFELDANMESAKYKLYEADTYDGGSNPNVYEVGSIVSL